MEANVVIDGVKYNYHVTEDGRVYSLDYMHTGKAKEMKCHIMTSRGGYRYVYLYKDGKAKNVRVARLVALTYIPNPEGKYTVDHINRIRTDDRVENLRWSTQKEQCNNRGEYPKNNKFSKPVICIETGVVYPSLHEIERLLGFSRGNIWVCCKNKLKTAYGYHWQYMND